MEIIKHSSRISGKQSILWYAWLINPAMPSAKYYQHEWAGSKVWACAATKDKAVEALISECGNKSISMAAEAVHVQKYVEHHEYPKWDDTGSSW